MRFLTDPFFVQFCLLATAVCAGATLSAWALGNAIGHRDEGGLRALLAAWVPAALVVLVTGWRDLSLAITLLYSSAVCAVTLMPGAALYFTGGKQPGQAADAEPGAASSPVLMLLLPLVLMLWLVGFGGRLDVTAAMALLIGGIVVARATWAAPTSPLRRQSVGRRLLGVVEALLGLAAASGAAVAAWQLGLFVRATGGRLPVELIAVTPLAPVLGIPLYVALAGLVHKNRRNQAASVASGFVLLNIAFLLPLLVVMSGLSRPGVPVSEAAFAEGWIGRAISDLSLGIPLILWRVESVILIIAVLALAGLKLGYYHAGRALGAGLLFLYTVYLFASIVLRLS